LIAVVIVGRRPSTTNNVQLLKLARYWRPARL
jgi:hypothetical protein